MLFVVVNVNRDLVHPVTEVMSKWGSRFKTISCLNISMKDSIFKKHPKHLHLHSFHFHHDLQNFHFTDFSFQIQL